MADRKPWMKELADQLSLQGVVVDWDMTEWQDDRCLYFKHPVSSIRKGAIVKGPKEFGILLEVRLYHSHLDRTGAVAVLKRRLAPLLEDGVHFGGASRCRGNTNIWSAMVYAKAADADGAVVWAQRFVETALDIVESGSDGRAIDTMTLSFFREMLPIAQIFEKFSLGLHRRDWENCERLPEYPRHDGHGIAVFFDKRGGIVKSLLAVNGRLDEAITEAFNPYCHDFLVPEGLVESFWQLPLEAKVASMWGEWIDNWIYWWRDAQLANPLDLDFEMNRWL